MRLPKEIDVKVLLHGCFEFATHVVTAREVQLVINPIQQTHELISLGLHED
jgi:hypothetical protein